MAREGASVVVYDGSYDEAVKEVASQAAAHGWQIVSDTAWPGYDEIPRWIMLGYTRIFDEAKAAWPRPPDVVVVQAGVGGLAAAAASWWNDQTAFKRPALICAEPTGAACLFESARGRPPGVAHRPTRHHHGGTSLRRGLDDRMASHRLGNERVRPRVGR